MSGVVLEQSDNFVQSTSVNGTNDTQTNVVRTHSVTTPPPKFKWRHWLTFSGPGALVAVGYIDPGNWATDLAGGSKAGYALLSVVLLSSLVAMLLQVMSARLGIATGKDLATLTKESWPRLSWPAWITAELAIIATDLAEVVGSALALKLLFSVPLVIGVVVTVLDVLLLLALDRQGSRLLVRIITSLLFIITCGFTYELLLARPVIGDVLQGFIPTTELVLNPMMLYLAIGIIGATIMPHNLYLHSSMVLRRWSLMEKGRAARLAAFDTILLLGGAMLLNAALVILAASVFHNRGHFNITDLTEAHHLLTPLLGTSIAAVVFALVLLLSAQSATITGTLAGQIVMTGFINFRMPLWKRRLLTRALSIVPAMFAIIYFGEQCTGELLVGSQVLLSLELPFTMIPLILLTSQNYRMGTLVNNTWMRWLGWSCAGMIVLANSVLIFQLIS